jgi:hypothetical protein
MGGGGSINTWVDEGLGLRDHIHLNKRGYAKLAGLLEAALLSGWSGPSTTLSDDEGSQ